MSSGAAAAAAGGGGRVSIPNNVKKIIQNIKEITGNSHTEEDIYAMLKECSMDPNETTHKLLFQDTFHEVKRKRDRRKENLNKEMTESRWKPGMQGRGSRGGRGGTSLRSISHDGGRNSASRKENGPVQELDKGLSMSSSLASQDTTNKEAISAASPLAAKSNGPNVGVSGNTTIQHDAHASVNSAAQKFEGLPVPAESKKNPVMAPETSNQEEQQLTYSGDYSVSTASMQPPGACFSASDTVLLPSQDSQNFSSAGTIRGEVGSQRTTVEQSSSDADKSKSTSASEAGSSILQGKIPNKSHGVGKNQHLESSRTVSSVNTSSSVSRSSSSYNNRSQVIGPQKVGLSKEWKPKSTNPILTQGSGTTSEAPAVSIDTNVQLQPEPNALDSKEANVELKRKLEELHISDGQYVIIPNHLHVPEADKLGFCFGSFDASFGIKTSNNSSRESDQSALSESSDGNEETAGDQFSSNQNEFAAVEEVDYSDHNQSSLDGPENLSSNEGGVSSSVVPEYNEIKQEATALGGHQHSVAHATPNYSLGFMPPILSNQLAPFEGSETQVRDVSRLPTFIVQQPFDPTSYYSPFYRSGADSDGRISPFHSAGAATKYNSNLAVVSTHTSQSSQEPLILSTTASTSPVTQAAGVMQSSVAVTQQPVSVFRPSTGLHLPHYPPNYIPYGHYFSPVYIPPPAMHQFLGNGAFPQQPQGGSVYPAPPPAAAKYSLPQYKPGTHTNNSSHVALPGSYGPYGSSMANYNPSSATASGNSTSNEDLAASHFRESGIYASGQQSEGSAVWIASSGRDISSLQASSFYNLPQGQMALTPAQPGHGTFAGVYHPAQPVSTATGHPLLQHSQTMGGPVDMVGPTAAVYQQPQHSQMNWPNNF